MKGVNCTKRFIGILLSLVLLMLVSFSFADDAVPGAVGAVDKQKRRDVFSFCETYTKRCIELKEEQGYDVQKISNYYYNDIQLPSTGLVRISCSAGWAYYDPSDFTIHEFQTVFLNLGYENEEAENQLLSAVMAMSALEYSDSDDNWMRFQSGTSALNKMLDIYTDQILPKLTGSFFTSLRMGNTLEIYRGNYTYTLEYHDVSDDVVGEYKVYYLYAQ